MSICLKNSKVCILVSVFVINKKWILIAFFSFSKYVLKMHKQKQQWFSKISRAAWQGEKKALLNVFIPSYKAQIDISYLFEN